MGVQNTTLMLKNVFENLVCKIAAIWPTHLNKKQIYLHQI